VYDHWVSRLSCPPLFTFHHCQVNERLLQFLTTGSECSSSRCPHHQLSPRQVSCIHPPNYNVPPAPLVGWHGSSHPLCITPMCVPISFHFLVAVPNCIAQTWNFAYFPMNQNYPYDHYGQVYNVSCVLDSSNRFNLTVYKEYSPLYLPTTYVMTYLFAFALSTCILIHTILYHGCSLWKRIKKIRMEQDDIHAKLMRNYPEVPDLWCLLAFVGFYCMMVLVVEVSHIEQLGSCVD